MVAQILCRTSVQAPFGGTRLECVLQPCMLLSLHCHCAGDGWARRAEDAILHGCLPVIIMDLVEEKFESLLDYGAFSVRVPEAELERVHSPAAGRFGRAVACAPIQPAAVFDVPLEMPAGF